jgi:hypothetical protein
VSGARVSGNGTTRLAVSAVCVNVYLLEIGIGDIIRFPPSPEKKTSKRVEIGVGEPWTS